MFEVTDRTPPNENEIAIREAMRLAFICMKSDKWDKSENPVRREAFEKMLVAFSKVLEPKL